MDVHNEGSKDAGGRMTEAPEMIDVSGYRWRVAYRAGEMPVLKLDIDVRKFLPELWQRMPETGVVLPSGQRVVLSLGVDRPFFFEEIVSDDVPSFKRKCAELRDVIVFEQWNRRTPLSIQGKVPRVTDSDSAIPSIESTVYGASLVNRSPLVAYGTLVYEPGGLMSPWRPFTTRWFRTQAEAEEARTKACEKLVELKLQARVTTIQGRLGALTSKAYFDKLPLDLQTKCVDRWREYVGLDDAWLADTSDFADKIEQMLNSLPAA